MLNLLSEPLVRVERADAQRTALSLPQVYSGLMADSVASFPMLRPHQRHAWHAFLVQLGAMAMERARVCEPPAGAQEWADLLAALTPDHRHGEPWHLVDDDITKPAFMQPPARSSNAQRDYREPIGTPDELDMLVTSKNHDLKSAVAALSGPDDWIFALCTLQTMEGFGGAGNYGISRMNGGLGNRPAFALAPHGAGPGPHVRRDIVALLEFLPEIVSDHPTTLSGHRLLWTLPWDGTISEALLIDGLHPLYVEVCRRIRLRAGGDGRLTGIRATSRAARIEGKVLKGRTGDPWTPTNVRKEGLPLTLGSGGFSYRRVSEYLTGSAEWMHPALLRPTRSERNSSATMRLVARAMVRGQGKTEGYHEREIPIRQPIRSAMLRVDPSPEPGEIASSRIQEIRTIQRILSHAIQMFAARGDHGRIGPEHQRLARPWLNRLDEILDARFFEDLQEEFEAEPSERQGKRNRWLMNDADGVIDHARSLLRQATSSLPCPSLYRYKAGVAAEALFEGRLRGSSGLPFLFDRANTGENEQ